MRPLLRGVGFGVLFLLELYLILAAMTIVAGALGID